MALLTFQVIEGLEAGAVFRDLATPLTIGREEDNDIQLNDERISRFHVKVQEDSGRIILTDLDSTNGTRVNGHPVRMRVLRPGDLIMVGRCVLLVGLGESSATTADLTPIAAILQANVADPNDPFDRGTAFPSGPPTPPSKLSALQTAEVSDMLDYLRTELVAALSLPTDEMHTHEGDYLRVRREAWTRLGELAPQISRYLSQLTNPVRDR
ncbi:FHA domain-containing protein [Planctomicrobium sp. SH664]|uniref:FHA domain-containing protein n=1 Tax=Planctomicrobium sp. SH664 TaxID=3448125 RepID=UPI003F5C93FF